MFLLGPGDAGHRGSRGCRLPAQDQLRRHARPQRRRAGRLCAADGAARRRGALHRVHALPGQQVERQKDGAIRRDGASHSARRALAREGRRRCQRHLQGPRPLGEKINWILPAFHKSTKPASFRPYFMIRYDVTLLL